MKKKKASLNLNKLQIAQLNRIKHVFGRSFEGDTTMPLPMDVLSDECDPDSGEVTCGCHTQPIGASGIRCVTEARGDSKNVCS